MNLKKFKIAIIIGTRAELIKTFPLMLELTNQSIPYYFIHTGQHNLGDLCTLFNIKKPDLVLTTEPKTSSKFNSKQIKAIFWNLSLLYKIRKSVQKLPCLKYVVYHGDTMSTASASIATSRLLNPFKKFKNVHLEAGLRSFNNFEPFPEEISRQIAGIFSDILLAPSLDAAKNLKRFRNKKVYVVGNTIVDSANITLGLAKKLKVKPIATGKFAIISVHRHENLKNKERMENIVEILCSINIPSFFYMHDNTKAKLKEFGLLKKLENCENISIVSPANYPNFIYQISNCSLIVCDGGSLQEESLIFGIPCILLRNDTERPEGLGTNFQFLSKLNVKKTKQKIKEFTSPMFRIEPYKNPYGEAGISKKIVSILMNDEIKNKS